MWFFKIGPLRGEKKFHATYHSRALFKIYDVQPRIIYIRVYLLTTAGKKPCWRC